MNKKLTTAIALVAALVGTQSVQAGLIGDSITGSLTANASNWGVITDQFDPTTAVVGAGVEFNGQYAWAPSGVTKQQWDIGVDVTDTTFTITANATEASYANYYGGSPNLYAYTSPLFSVHLGDLNGGDPISGLTLLSGLATVGTTTVWNVFTTTNTADSIDITFYNLPSSLNGAGSWTFAIAPLVASVSEPLVAAVPEPSTYALMLAGLVGFVARRKKQASA